MSIRADSNSKFLRRFLLIAAVCFGYVIWGSYDALVKGPKELEKANIYWTVNSDGASVPRYASSGGEWTKIAKEKGWDIGQPKTPAGAKGFLYFNYALVAVCLVAGGLATYKFLKTNNTWIEADTKNFKSSWGPSFAFDEIKSIDKTKWERKGVAKITYDIGQGEQLFVLDDFKYLREETDTILYNIEQTLSDDQILNGPRELSPEARAEAKRLEEEKRKQLDVVEDE